MVDRLLDDDDEEEGEEEEEVVVVGWIDWHLGKVVCKYLPHAMHAISS